MDAILFDEKPYYIDINPRIVEPMNALLSGVDLVDPVLQISFGKRAMSKNEETVKFGIEGVETHQRACTFESYDEGDVGSVYRGLEGVDKE